MTMELRQKMTKKLSSVEQKMPRRWLSASEFQTRAQLLIALFSCDGKSLAWRQLGNLLRVFWEEKKISLPSSPFHRKNHSSENVSLPPPLGPRQCPSSLQVSMRNVKGKKIHPPVCISHIPAFPNFSLDLLFPPFSHRPLLVPCVYHGEKKLYEGLRGRRRGTEVG